MHNFYFFIVLFCFFKFVFIIISIIISVVILVSVFSQITLVFSRCIWIPEIFPENILQIQILEVLGINVLLIVDVVQYVRKLSHNIGYDRIQDHIFATRSVDQLHEERVHNLRHVLRGLVVQERQYRDGPVVADGLARVQVRHHGHGRQPHLLVLTTQDLHEVGRKRRDDRREPFVEVADAVDQVQLQELPVRFEGFDCIVRLQLFLSELGYRVLVCVKMRCVYKGVCLILYIWIS